MVVKVCIRRCCYDDDRQIVTQEFTSYEVDIDTLIGRRLLSVSTDQYGFLVLEFEDYGDESSS